MQQQQRTDRSLGDLFGDLMGEVGTLIRQEVALAKTEMSDKVAKTGRQIGYLAVGGAVAYAGALFLLATLVIILATVGVPLWLSTLLVGLAVGAVGFVLVRKGLSGLGNVDLVPHQTVETLKPDSGLAKEQTR